MNTSTLVDAIATAIAGVTGSMLGQAGEVAPAVSADSPRWILRMALIGPVSETVYLGISEADGLSVAKAVMAVADTPSDTAVTDALSELCGRAVGALAGSAELRGLGLAECVVEPSAPAGTGAVYRVTAGDAFTGVIHIWPAQPSAHALTRQGPGASAESMLPANLDVILDIDLPLSVRFGETEMTLSSLTRLAPGSVIDLGRSPDDPVDVLVNGRLIARAEVVVVSGNYGVRITEVISAADRLRSVAL